MDYSINEIFDGACEKKRKARSLKKLAYARDEGRVVHKSPQNALIFFNLGLVFLPCVLVTSSGQTEHIVQVEYTSVQLCTLPVNFWSMTRWVVHKSPQNALTFFNLDLVFLPCGLVTSSGQTEHIVQVEYSSVQLCTLPVNFWSMTRCLQCVFWWITINLVPPTACWLVLAVVT